MVKMSLDKNVENRWLVLTHWLRVPERIKYRLAVLVYRCRNHTAPEFLARDLHWVADDDSTTSAIVNNTAAQGPSDETPHSRRSGLSSRRSSCVECAACIGCFCSVTDCLQESLKDASVSAAVL